ncbi:MAG: glycosyltransferase [Lachnospiraceae bacterium]|nr:glycosyltransferase [Lachnospiraceae bacterium]
MKVSVIVPVYNAEKYLSRCIDSILNQTLKELELILVDDESTDSSPAICDRYSEADPRVKVIHKKNGGPGMARNSGLEVATGEFVAFVDSDDYIDPVMYESMYNEIKANNTDSCLCGFLQIDTKGTVYENPNPLHGKSYYGQEVIDDILFNILGSKPDAESDFVIGVAVWKGLYSMQVIRDNNLTFYSERVFYSEDTMFNVDYFLHSNGVSVVKEMYYHYLENEVSFTKTYKTDMHDKNVRFFREVDSKLQRLDNHKEGKMRLSRLFLGFMRYYLQRIVELYSRKEAIKLIKGICKDECIQEVLHEYPYKKNPIKQRIIHSFVVNKHPALVWFVIKIKNN